MKIIFHVIIRYLLFILSLFKINKNFFCINGRKFANKKFNVMVIGSFYQSCCTEYWLYILIRIFLIHWELPLTRPSQQNITISPSLLFSNSYSTFGNKKQVLCSFFTYLIISNKVAFRSPDSTGTGKLKSFFQNEVLLLFLSVAEDSISFSNLM